MSQPTLNLAANKSSLVTMDRCAYLALIQRGLVAGLSPKQIVNAVMETTGATEQTILNELRALTRSSSAHHALSSAQQ